MTKQVLLSALAVASLSFTACSTEPSDWRPENKVSLDMVAPGTRTSDNFDQHSSSAPNQAKGGAIEAPISSHATLEKQERPSANQNVTANGAKAEITKKATDRAKAGGVPVQAEDETELKKQKGHE
jgi:hypothetical protein